MPNKKSLYKHVLVATDLSSHTNEMMKRATEIARCTHAKLSIAHVMPHGPIAYAGEFSIPIDAEQQTLSLKISQKQLRKLGEKFDIPAKSQYLLEGSVKLAITELAKSIGADLIIVGTHGHQGIELLLGSQANAILHAAKCDVWVIRIK